jgi:hypothetical protein
MPEQQSRLDWPDEFERTEPRDREQYPGGFRVTRSTAFQNVLDELRTWDGVTVVDAVSNREELADRCENCRQRIKRGAIST